MTQGRCGSLLLHRGGLSPPTSCRSPGALEPKNGPERRMRSRGSDFRSIALAVISSGMFFEQIELSWDGAACWRDGLVVTAYLGEMGRLELQGEFHQGVGDVAGGFVGDGVFGRFGFAPARTG